MVEVGVARVYAIRSPDGLFCYIGSTLGSLRCRLTRHKWRALAGERPNSKLHLMAQLGPETFTVELIATVPLNERFRTEAQHIRSHGNLNMVMPLRTEAQRRAERRAEARAARQALLG